MTTVGHIFLSYRSIEADFALKLAADLKNAGVNLWMDRFDIKPGQDWREEIEKALATEVCAAMIAAMSPEYLASDYCRIEMARAKRLSIPIFPVMMRSIPAAQLPLETERLQHIDFTDWRDERTYRQQFEKLLDELRAKAAAQMGVTPDAETRYLNRLIAELEAHQGVLEYVELKGAADAPPDPEPIRPAPRKQMAAGLSLLLQPSPPTPIPLSEAEGEGRMNAPEKIPLRDIREAVQKHPRFVLIGEPGAGKTTTIRRLALEAARARLENPRTTPLPLFLRLPSWGDEPTPADFVRKQWRDEGLPADADPIGLLSVGGALLYLDGLNEMGGQGAEKAKKLREWMEAKDAPRQAIVTCRAGDYAGDLKLGDMPTVLAEEMDEGQIRQFAAKYLKDKSELFLARLSPEMDMLWREREARSLFQLARNPYLLMALVVVYDNAPDGDLPGNNGALFRALAGALWAREEEAQTPGWIAFEHMEEAFGRLAFAMIDENRPIDVSLYYALNYVGSSALLKAGRSASFIEIRGEEVRFYHQLMQEYFAAVKLGEAGLSRELEPPTFVRGLRRSQKWDQVIVSLCGVSNVEAIIREVTAIDPYLAADCLASGIEVGTTHQLTLSRLLDTLRREHEEAMLQAAAAALGKIGAVAVPGLLDALRDKYESVRWAAAAALGKIGAAAAVPGLIEGLTDTEEVLFFIGFDDRPILGADALERRAGRIRVRRVCDAAAEALRRIGTPEALAAVEAWRREQGGQ